MAAAYCTTLNNVYRSTTNRLFYWLTSAWIARQKIINNEHSVQIHSKEINVSAAVHTLGGWSAHGDQQDLLRWYKTIKDTPPVYLVHGESESGKKLQSYFFNTTKDVYLTKLG
jgi:metallo-beta-lactamase family protein